MADAPEPGSAWGPIGLLILIIGGSLLALYIQGNLGKLDTKSLLIPPPQQTDTNATSSASNDNYGAQQSVNGSYTVQPYSNN